MFTSRMLSSLRRWPVDSQQRSRRNAMIACTALAQRRAEREEVAEYFAAAPAPEEQQPRVARG